MSDPAAHASKPGHDTHTPPPPAVVSALAGKNTVETPYKCKASCVGRDSEQVLTHSPELAAEINLTHSPVNHDCPSCVNQSAPMSKCDEFLSSVECTDPGSTAESYIWKGLGCGYRCVGPKAAAAIPEVPAPAKKAIDASLPKAVNASAKGIWTRIMGTRNNYYVIAIVVVVLLVVAGFVHRMFNRTSLMEARRKALASLPVPLDRL